MRHVVGFLNRPTTDGRVIKSIRIDEPVHVMDENGLLDYSAMAFDIVDDVITCWIDRDISPTKVLSLNLVDVTVERLTRADGVPQGTWLSDGKLIALTLKDRSKWAWQSDLPAPGPNDPRIHKSTGPHRRCNNWHGYRGKDKITDCFFTFEAASKWVLDGGLDEVW